MDAFAVLHACAAFADLSHDAVERLAAASRVQDCTSGEVLVHAGEIGAEPGVVVSGHLLAGYRPGGDPVGIQPGDVFGEAGVLAGGPALGDVAAQVPTRVLRFPVAALARELGEATRTHLTALLVARLSRPSEEALRAAAAAAARTRRAEQAPLDGRPILVLNMGSSSLKYALFRDGTRRVEGTVERVGQAGSRFRHDGPAGRLEDRLDAPDHRTALARVLDLLVDVQHGGLDRLEDLAAVGHRVVHGGDQFSESVVIDDAVRDEIRRCVPLAPLHNPANLAGIDACTALLPQVPQVAVFDTAFHMTLPEHAWRYSLPRELADRARLRRYGFHGTSHKYVTRTTGAFLGRSPRDLRIVSCHLGNGASVCAVDHGRSVDTSMGLTPLEGLVMGTRSGDVDPGLLLHLLGTGLTASALDTLLNKESGLKGLSGLSSDMRELEKGAEAGHAGALLAIQAFCYRVRKYVGAYAAAMGGLDVLAFTGGIGENAAGVRSRVCQGLAFFGVSLDEEANRRRPERGQPAMDVAAASSAVRILVIPADEEGSIAVETDHALERAGVTRVMRTRRDRPIRLSVSAHHVHLSQAHVEALYGPGHQLTFKSALFQDGEFASAETVDLLGPKGRVDKVRVLGPTRAETQVEISRTEEFKLGIDAPVRMSGDLDGTPGLTLLGTVGQVRLEKGVICAHRHIHMSPDDAVSFGLRDGDEVRVEVDGPGRDVVFGDVAVRVKPAYKLEMHIDTDEANAAEVGEGTIARIDRIQHRRG